MLPPGVEDAADAAEQLASDPEWERRHAGATSRWADWTEVVDPLIDRLVGGDERTRERAATALGWVGDDAAVDPLVGRLRADESAAVRAAAATALGAVGDDDAVAPLTETVETDPDPAVRATVAAALPDCGGVSEAVEVVETYRGPDREGVVRETVGALATGDAAAREAAVEFLLTGATPVRRVAAAQLPATATDARTALTTALADDDPGVRAAAARSLGDHVAALDPPSLGERLLRRIAGDRASTDSVVAALAAVLDGPERDPDPDVRRAAVQALARAPDGRSVVERALDAAADDEAAAVREAATGALRDRGPKERTGEVS